MTIQHESLLGVMYITEVRATRLQRMDRKPKDATEHEAAEEAAIEEVPF